MISTFHGIELGKRGLISHQGALSTTGHNLTNASNPDYSRQKVQIQTYHPIYPPGLNRAETAGQIGSGNILESIQRVRDEYLDDRILNEHGNHNYWQEKSFYLTQLEHLHNEPNAENLQTRFELFITSWNNLANNPTEGGMREALRSTAKAFTHHIQRLHTQFTQLRQQANQSIAAKVTELNTYIKQIADLNKEITKIEAMGDHPNDLLDSRDALIEKLSKLTNISVGRSDQDEFLVYLNSERLVQGDKYEKLQLISDPLNEGLFRISWSDGREVLINNGALGGLISARDKDIRSEIDNINTIALNLIETVNEIHRDGLGLNLNSGTDFFAYKSFNNLQSPDFDSNTDGTLDSTSLYKVHGKQILTLDDVAGTSGTITIASREDSDTPIEINYSSTDTVRDILHKINKSQGDILSYLNHKGQVTIKAINPRKRHSIQTLQDTGIFLTQYTGILKESGPTGAYTAQAPKSTQKLQTLDYTPAAHPHPASWISISSAIASDINNIAAARGLDTNGDGLTNLSNGENDGSNALRIVAALSSENEQKTLSKPNTIDQNPIMLDHHSKSFRAFINTKIQALGAKGQKSQLEFKKESVILEKLIHTKESISGVNIDEELTAMISYQHGYNASARFITYVDKMLETIIHRMGI